MFPIILWMKDPARWGEDEYVADKHETSTPKSVEDDGDEMTGLAARALVKVTLKANNVYLQLSGAVVTLSEYVN